MGRLVGILHFNYFYSKLIELIFHRCLSHYTYHIKLKQNQVILNHRLKFRFEILTVCLYKQTFYYTVNYNN